MKNNIIGFAILVLFAILLIFAFGINRGYIEGDPAKYTAFTQCLANKNVVFYGAWWCPACIKQKAFFENALKNEPPYFECASKGNRGQLDNPVCSEKNIVQTPTWTIPERSERYGTLSREALSYLSGCSLTLAGEEDIAEKTGEEVLKSILMQIRPEILKNEESFDHVKSQFTENNVNLQEKTGVEITKQFAVPIENSSQEQK